MIHYHLLFTFFLFSSTLFAQNTLTYGEIAPTDIALTVYEPDPNTDAVILDDYGQIEFDPNGFYRFKRLKRVKVFNRSAFNQGDIAIGYLRGNGYNLYDVEAAVIAPDGTRQELTKDDMFDEKVVGDRYEKKFSIPNLQEGSIIEYKYETTSRNFVSLRNWYFQTSIPTRRSELEITVPEWLDYIKLVQGDLQPTQQEVTPDRYVRGSVSYQQEKTRYVFENVPAMKPEAYITTMDDYRSGIQFQLKRVALPGHFTEEFMTTWEQLAHTLLEENRFFADTYQRKGMYRVLAEAVEPLLNKNMTEREKAQVIYDYINETMDWDEYYSILASEESLGKTFKERKGNSADLNLMVAAMLEQQKINFVPILVSTRSHGKMYPFYPIISQFNHVVLRAELDGEQVYIDAAADQYLPLGMLRPEAVNKIGWEVKPGSSNWIVIEPEEAVDVMIADLDLEETGKITGNIQWIQKGYSALRDRKLQRDKPEGEYLRERLSARFTDPEISNVAFKNIQAVNEELRSEFECSLDAAQIAGDLLYFAPIIHSDFLENRLKLEQRTYPIEMNYPIQEQSIVTINLPAGYVVEELPEDATVMLPNTGGKFQYMLSAKDNSIKLISKVILKQLYFEPQEYAFIKEFYDLIAEKLGEQIVLKKSTIASK